MTGSGEDDTDAGDPVDSDGESIDASEPLDGESTQDQGPDAAEHRASPDEPDESDATGRDANRNRVGQERPEGPENRQSEGRNGFPERTRQGRASTSSGPHGERDTGPPIRTGQEPDAEEEEEEWVFVIRDLLVTIFAVLLVGGYLFAISGVWPPMVAIESGSMEPNMEVNDMVFVMETERFQPGEATGNTGVVPARVGEQTGYEQFGKSGDVIIFEPGGNGAETPIIHRAMFWVEEGENWCEMANPDYLGRLEPSDASCEAPHDGFITKGDANPRYDQASFGESGAPVKPEWIVGTAEIRLPRLGWFRLQL